MTAFGANEVALGETMIDAALATQEEVRRAPSQFTRQGITSPWFSPRDKVLVGEKTKFRVFTKGYRGARATTFAGMAGTEGPPPMKVGHVECSYSWNDLMGLRAGIKWNMMQDLKHKNLTYAVYNLVNELFSEAEADMAERINTGLMLSYTASMGKVVAMFDVDGSTMTGIGGHAAAYIQVKDAPISRFQEGDVLELYDVDSASGTDYLNARVYVHDVIHGENGPPKSDGSRVENIGPGLIVEPCDALGATSSVNYSDAAKISAGTDFLDSFIARSGEFQTSTTVSTTGPNNFHGFPDWFDWSVGCLRDGDGTYITRTADGMRWTNPLVITPDGVTRGTSSTYKEFDPDEHLVEYADTCINLVKAGRKERRSIGKGMPGGVNKEIKISDHLVMVVEPKMGNHIVNGAEDKLRFTHASTMNEASAKALRMIGVEGFEGYVWHSFTLGEVAIVADTNCQPHSAFILEPSSFFWIEPPGGQRVQWLPFTGGSRIWPIAGNVAADETYGTPTMSRQAMAYSMLGLMCDQPRANAMIECIITAREAA